MERIPLLEGKDCREILEQCELIIEKSSWEDIEYMFEEDDDPALEYDIEPKPSTVMDSALSLTIVATFLAGFVASDLSSFKENDWYDMHWVVPVLYLCMLAFAEGCCIYVAIVGSVGVAAFQRACNQNVPWPSQCERALAPIKTNLKQLKGKRMAMIRQVIASVVKRYDSMISCIQERHKAKRRSR